VSGRVDCQGLEKRFSTAVKLPRRPVAVCLLDAIPTEIEKFSGTEPSSCSYWRLAAGGRVFYTVPKDHFNCAVGAYTHNIALSPERENETQQTLKMMFELNYVKPEEVAQIPRLAQAPAAIAYAPLGDSPFAPDVVLFSCIPAVAMLLNEAANRAGVTGGALALGRPTCMALPVAMQHGATLSLGCIGNRVYTGLSEDEMYMVFRGRDLVNIADALDTVLGANVALRAYATTQRQHLASA
jgi:uncharacterized protein (DUF169 family)